MISLNELKEACQEYDKEKGDYPESPKEGYAVYHYILESMGLAKTFGVKLKDWVEEME